MVTPSYASNHHKRTITALKFVGQTLVSGSVDKSLKIWTLNERKLPGHASPMVKSTFKHPPVPIGGWTPAQLSRINLQQALVRKMEKTCDSIEKINPTCVRTLHGHQAAIKCLDFTPHVLISGDTLGFVKIWHVPSGNCLGTIDMNNIKPGPMQFEKVSGKISGMHNPLDKEAGSTKQEDEKSDPISFVSFKENRLAIGKFSGAMYFYAIYPYDLWLKLPGTTTSSTSIQYENLKQWCEEPSTFELLGVYELETGKVDKSNEEFVPRPTNRTWALCGGSEGRCVLWNHREGKRIYSLKGDIIMHGQTVINPPTHDARDAENLLGPESASRPTLDESTVSLSVSTDPKSARKKLSSAGPGGRNGRKSSYKSSETLAASSSSLSAADSRLIRQKPSSAGARNGRKTPNASVSKMGSGASIVVVDDSAAATSKSADNKNKSTTGVAFDNRFIISGSMDGILRIWDCVF
ncbi:MAG: hypothetical protein SGCHY_001591 [Lobulomycetales sp.]